MVDTLEITNQLLLTGNGNAVIKIDAAGSAIPPNPLKQITISAIHGMEQYADDPLLYIDGSIQTDNDIIVYGSITTMTDPAKQAGGGALVIGHGWLGSKPIGATDPIALSPPLIELLTSSEDVKIYDGTNNLPLESNMTVGQAGQICCVNTGTQKDLYIWNGEHWELSEQNVSGKYDTLFLRQYDTTLLNPTTTRGAYPPANLDLGDLTAHGKLKLRSTNSTFAVAAGDNGAADNYAYLIPINPPNGGLGLGTYEYPFVWLDSYTVFTDKIVNLHNLFAKIQIMLKRIIPSSSSSSLMRSNSIGMQTATLDQEETIQAIVIDSDETEGLKQKHLNGLVDEWYSDDEVTLKATVNGTTGHITGTGLTVNGNANIDGYAQFNNDAKLIWVNTSTLEVQTAGGEDGALNVGNLYVSGNINPLGAQGYIGFNTKLRLSGDFQISDGHVVSSLNPSGSVGLGSPTEPWTGVTAQTVYTESIKHLNGTDWSFPWNGGTVTLDITVSKSSPAIYLACTSHTPYHIQSATDDKLYFSNATTNLAYLNASTLWLSNNLYVTGGATIQNNLGVNGTLTTGGLNISNPSISNVTGSRQLSVDRDSVYYNYYNTSGRAKLVHVSVVITGCGANGYYSSQIVLAWSTGWEIIANAQNDYCTHSNSFTFLVPNGWSYQIKDSSAAGHTGGVTIQSVHELTL